MMQTSVGKKFIFSYLLGLTILSVIGARMVALYKEPSLLFVYVPLLSVAPLIYLKFYSSRKVFFVYVISITLLYHISLSSQYLSGADIQVEYYLANKVLEDGHWDPSIPHTYDTALSVTILLPALSLVTSIELLNVLKMIYPLIFGFVPVILFKMFLKLGYRNEDAFLSTFYFISIFPFFTELLQLGRQMMAEVLLAILLYILVINFRATGEKTDKRSLFILAILLFALVFSHYGTYYSWLSIFVIFEMILLFFFKRTILLYLIIASFAFDFLYHVNVSQGSVFKAAVLTAYIFVKNIRSLASPYYAQGVEYIVKEKTTLHQVLTYLYIFSLALVALGVLQKILWVLRYIHSSKKSINMEKDKALYYLLSIVAAIFFLLTGISTLSAALNITRIYHLTLFVLAPSFIDGFNFMGRLVRTMKLPSMSFVAASFLVVFILFNTGYMYELANVLGYPEQSFSSALNPQMDRDTPSTQDYYAIMWLKYYAQHNSVYSDLFGRTILWAYFDASKVKPLSSASPERIEDNSLIFIRRYNEHFGTILTIHYYKNVQIREILNTTGFMISPCIDRIYSNGATILLKISS
jgi:uncharacterized membrane protein